jgi:hypothetical protein
VIEHGLADLHEPNPDRWPCVCRLLSAPQEESRRLARLLAALPLERRRHRCHDEDAA